MTGPPRILVIGDVMTDVIVRPEGPLARGSDRRASVTVQPGGSAANQAAWLASFGVKVDFVARVGAADLKSETARFKSIGVTPHLVGDPNHETGRLIALIDPDGERSFLTDRGANEALEARDVSDALIANASHIRLSGYSFLPPSPRAPVLDVMWRRGTSPSASTRRRRSSCARSAPTNSSPDARRDNPVPQRRGSSGSPAPPIPKLQCARLAALYPLVVIGAARPAPRPRKAGARGKSRRARAGGSTSPAVATPPSRLFSPKASAVFLSTTVGSLKWLTPPARATPSSPDFWPPGLWAPKLMLHLNGLSWRGLRPPSRSGEGRGAHASSAQRPRRRQRRLRIRLADFGPDYTAGGHSGMLASSDHLSRLDKEVPRMRSFLAHTLSAFILVALAILLGTPPSFCHGTEWRR
jgi:hypothetical protein